MENEIYRVRQVRPKDFISIIKLTKKVYPQTIPWSQDQLASHLKIFPEGQLVVVNSKDKVVGYAASLIVDWNDYEFEDNWRDFTDSGFFTNHDPVNGRTLYGAEIFIDPDFQGRGLGKKLYAAREELAKRMDLVRIRAGARLAGYSHYAQQMTAQEYLDKVVQGELGDPTLSFQLRRGFKAIRLVKDYLRNDPESQGYAAVIEWLNPQTPPVRIPAP